MHDPVYVIVTACQDMCTAALFSNTLLKFLNIEYFSDHPWLHRTVKQLLDSIEAARSSDFEEAGTSGAPLRPSRASSSPPATASLTPAPSSSSPQQQQRQGSALQVSSSMSQGVASAGVPSRSSSSVGNASGSSRPLPPATPTMPLSGLTSNGGMLGGGGSVGDAAAPSSLPPMVPPPGGSGSGLPAWIGAPVDPPKQAGLSSLGPGRQLPAVPQQVGSPAAASGDSGLGSWAVSSGGVGSGSGMSASPSFGASTAYTGSSGSALGDPLGWLGSGSTGESKE